MNWEYIYEKLCEEAINHRSPLANKVYSVLNKELNDKIIIKKGENRHPYAEVLHEWIEGAEMQVGTVHFNEIYVCHQSAIKYFDRQSYCIKPSAPVYEWQWYKIVNGHIEILNEVSIDGRHQFFTEYEADTSIWKKFEETKRERK